MHTKKYLFMRGSFSDELLIDELAMEKATCQNTQVTVCASHECVR